jgi:hypothetical protein
MGFVLLEIVPHNVSEEGFACKQQSGPLENLGYLGWVLYLVIYQSLKHILRAIWYYPPVGKWFVHWNGCWSGPCCRK